MTKKKIFILSLTVITAAAASLLFTAAFRISSANLARETLSKEIAAIEKETGEVENSNEELSSKISDIEAELSTKETINNYYMEYKKTHDELTSEIEDLKKESSELDKKISDKRLELEGSSGLSEGKKGASYLLERDETYICPDAVPEGRYTATGSGTLTVLNSSGRARLSQNLDVAYGNSYTFNLYEKEKIKVTGEVILTELK